MGNHSKGSWNQVFLKVLSDVLGSGDQMLRRLRGVTSFLKQAQREDALVSAHEIEPKNPDVAAALKQLKKNMEDYKWRTRILSQFGTGSPSCKGKNSNVLQEHPFGIAASAFRMCQGDVAKEMFSGKAVEESQEAEDKVLHV